MGSTLLYSLCLLAATNELQIIKLTAVCLLKLLSADDNIKLLGREMGNRWLSS